MNSTEIISGEIVLYDLYKLMEFNEFNKCMALKIGQLVGDELQECIAEYRRKKDTRLQELARDLLQEDEAPGKESYPPIYKFELTQFGKDDWGVTELDPYPPAHIPYYILMPGHVIQALAKACTKYPTGKLLKEDDVTIRANYKKTVDFRFVRLSRNHIVGALREKIEPQVIESVSKEKKITEEIQFPFQELLYKMHQDPLLEQKFLMAFLLHLLPVLEKKEAG